MFNNVDKIAKKLYVIQISCPVRLSSSESLNPAECHISITPLRAVCYHERNCFIVRKKRGSLCSKIVFISARTLPGTGPRSICVRPISKKVHSPQYIQCKAFPTPPISRSALAIRCMHWEGPPIAAVYVHSREKERSHPKV